MNRMAQGGESTAPRDAEALWAKKKQRSAEALKDKSRHAAAQKTARLRQLRLAKEAADKEADDKEADVKRAAPPRRKSGRPTKVHAGASFPSTSADRIAWHP